MNLADREPNAIDALDAELPEGWTSATVGDLVEAKYGKGLIAGNRVTGNVPVFGSNGVVGYHNAFLASKPTIIIGRKGSVGAVHKSLSPCWPIDTTYYVNDFGGLDMDYFYYALHRLDLSDLDASTAIPGLNRDTLYSQTIAIPPLTEQRRIVAKVEQLLAVANASRERLARVPTLLKRFRQAVLAAVCSGRLTADWREQHLDEEPAAQLLERILAERRAKWEAAQAGKRGRFSGKAGAHFVDIEGVTSSEGDPRTFNAVVPGFDGSVVEQLFRKQQAPGQAKYQEPTAPDTSELPELPENWAWCSAEQVCETITKGTTPSSEKMSQGAGEIPYIKVYNLTFDGRLDFTNNPTFVNHQTHSHELSRSRVFPGDVLMNIVGPPLGKVSVVPNLFPEWNINQAIAFFRLLPGFDRSFLVDCLSTEWILSTISFRAKATAGQHNLTLEQCRSLPLPLPPVSEQQEIVCRVERLFKFADAVERCTAAAAAHADRLTQAILAKAFRGELVPTEADLARAQGRGYAPASSLLERIEGPQEKIGLPPAGRNGSERNPIGRSV